VAELPAPQPEPPSVLAPLGDSFGQLGFLSSPTVCSNEQLA